jgi:hypothetical protein
MDQVVQTNQVSRASILRSLPTEDNDLGLPLYIYRADLLPDVITWNSLSQGEKSDYTLCARIPISYPEGFPIMPSGSLFWDQMEHEGDTEYALFTNYLGQLATKGYRALKFIATTNQALQYLNELSSLYFWCVRARAHDMVSQAAYRRIRDQRAILSEDYNYTRLTPLVDKMYNVLDSYTTDDLQSLSPLEATKMLKELSSMQRLSVGLSPSAPSSDHLPGGNTPQASMELQLQTIAKQTNVSNINTTNNNNNNNLNILLDDEESTVQAQQLIIRMMMSKNK